MTVTFQRADLGVHTVPYVGQVNVKSGFRRKVLREQVEVPQNAPDVDSSSAPAPAARDRAAPGTFARARASKTGTKVKDEHFPIERIADTHKETSGARGEDSLVMHVGQLLQTSRQRPDGWAFGSVILDELLDRPPIAIDGVSEPGRVCAAATTLDPKPHVWVGWGLLLARVLQRLLSTPNPMFGWGGGCF